MDNLMYARLQMAFSLGFHIIFAVIGIGMPVLMAVAEYRWLRTGNPASRQLAVRWAKGTAIFFAVGAVSGTVLSFELGLLWPRFMAFAGGIVGFPFALEGFAFFTEAIFLGIYFYAWSRIHRWAHWTAGVIVAVSGAASAFFVITVNAWMNHPTGFDLDPATGDPVNIDPVAAMFNPVWRSEVTHMLVAAYAATGFGAAGIHAIGLLRHPASRFHREALAIAMLIGGAAAIVQPVVGHYAAQVVAETQPVKLAAMEGQFRTERGAPLRIGGLPDETALETPWAIELPNLLSFLAFNDFGAEIKGLEEFPRDQWPPVAVVHVSFQIMVAIGVTLMAVAVWFFWRFWRLRAVPTSRGLLIAIVACAPLGFIAIECGWIVTEVGRQPWIINGVMRTADAVTPMPGLAVPFFTFLVLYGLLACIVATLIARQVRAVPEEVERAA